MWMIWSVVWVLVGVGVLLCALQWWLQTGEDARHFSRMPGPPGLPILGNALEIIVNTVELFRKSRVFANAYPELYKIQVMDKRVVVICNPADIEAVLSSTKYNEKGYLYSFLRPWLQEGLLLSNGAKWHSRRKILTPAFHFNILRHFSHILEENSQRLVHDLEAELDQEKTDLVPLMSSYALQCICETAMGTRLEEKSKRYENSIHELGKHFIKRMTSFWLHPNWAFELSALGRRQKRTLEDVWSFPKRVIEERRRDMQQYGCAGAYAEGSADEGELRLAGGRKRMAMLDLLLSAEREGLIDTAGVQEEVDTFMFEAHDTTSAALSYTLLCLANSQDIQDRVVAELDSIFGGSKRAASMSELTEMKYLECCVKEALRLYPPVPFIARHLGEQLQLKDYVVPAGTQCHISIIDLHRRADLFHEPLHFRPERFLSDRGDSRHPYAYIPFSAGPRNCIGQKFAMLELKSALAAVLSRYRVLPCTTHDQLVHISDFLLRTNHPIYVQFRPRK